MEQLRQASDMIVERGGGPQPVCDEGSVQGQLS